MAIRWRCNGELVCAAKSEEMPGDRYISDSMHYHLSVMMRVLIPYEHEGETGLWHWNIEYFDLSSRDTEREYCLMCGTKHDDLHMGKA